MTLPPIDIEAPVAELDAREKLLRFAAGSQDPGLVEFLRRGLRDWLFTPNAGGLAEALGLEGGQEARRRAARDAALHEALAALRITSPEAGAGDLAEAWNRFVDRGPWRAWRGDAEAPADASQLNRALHQATLWARGEPLTERQLRNVLRKSAG